MSKLDGGDMVGALEAGKPWLPTVLFGFPLVASFIPGKLPLQERSKLRSFFADYDLVPSLGGGRTDVEKLLAGGLGGISGVEISRWPVHILSLSLNCFRPYSGPKW